MRTKGLAHKRRLVSLFVLLLIALFCFISVSLANAGSHTIVERPTPEEGAFNITIDPYGIKTAPEAHINATNAYSYEIKSEKGIRISPERIEVEILSAIPVAGQVSISSSPSGARVYLDGNYKGTTPLILKDVSVGSHTIKLSKKYYYDFEKKITVSAGETTYVSKILKGYGFVKITSDPSGAYVYIDGSYKGVTPLLLNVEEGYHKIILAKSNYFHVEKQIYVAIGETTYVSETLKGYGSLEISTIPSGINVYLDGNYKGETPLFIGEVAEGTHSIRLTKFGYGDITRTVSVFAGKTTHVTENLILTHVIEKSILTSLYPIPPIALFLILFSFFYIILHIKRKRDKMKKEGVKQTIKKTTDREKKEIHLTIERAIYDPCKRDFIEGALPRMKEWINRYDTGAYWFAVSIQNNTDRAIEEWGVE